MILHNDHSLRIGTGPANTRKHVFKISRARQVPLLASLRPSLRTSARARAPCFDPALALRKSYDSREIPSKFELHRANYRPSFQECRVHHSHDLIVCQHFRTRATCINSGLLTLYNIMRDV